MNRSIEMRKIREILRLKNENGLSNRKIAESIGCSKDSVNVIIGRVQAIGLTWPLSADMNDEVLEEMIYPSIQPKSIRPEPDWNYIHRELKRKHVTLMLLWHEYKRDYPDGLMYSQFCEKYRQWHKLSTLTMPQRHKAGEKLFLDWAGDTVDIIDIATGKVLKAFVFVAALGASNYAFAEAFLSQNLPCWIQANIHALHHFKGCPEILVPDNTKTAVDKPCFYEPVLNRSYQEMAAYYGIAVVPARIRKPKDKSKVENAVLNVERFILAALRNQKYFSLSELNESIFQRLHEFNHKPFQKMEGSRYTHYMETDLPSLRPLPQVDYELAEWKTATLHVDYHVEFGGNLYSAPYQYVGQKVDIRAGSACIEIFHKGVRIAGHPRSYSLKRTYVTNPEHVPAKHRHLMQWNPERFIRWASQTGPYTSALVEKLLESKAHVEQGYRACLGILRLTKNYPAERMENAAKRALASHAISYYSVKSILEKGLDKLDAQNNVRELPLQHANIRGAEYYNERS
jgi:transposase